MKKIVPLYFVLPKWTKHKSKTLEECCVLLTVWNTILIFAHKHTHQHTNCRRTSYSELIVYDSAHDWT